MDGKRKAGRPTTAAKEGEKATLGIRASARLKGQLMAAAAVTGRSLSAEAEIRLEQSFEEQRHLLHALAAVFGDRIAGLLLEIGAVLDAIARHRSFRAHSIGPQADLTDDPFRYDQAMQAVARLLERARPPGDIRSPELPSGMQPEIDASPDMRILAELMEFERAPGNALAEGILSQLPTATAPVHRIARDLLGADLVKRLSRPPQDDVPAVIRARVVSQQ